VVDAFNPPELWQPFGPFSQVAVQGDGRIVHLKGQVALDRDGRIVGAGDMRAQLRQVLENIRTALSSVGGEMGDTCRWPTTSPTWMPSWQPAISGAATSRRRIR
jgi:2-iminobutanoate/2-iminopropanoate deaminase